MVGATQNLKYGKTQKGNVYQYQKTDKAKKAGALLGAGAGIARFQEYTSNPNIIKNLNYEKLGYFSDDRLNIRDLTKKFIKEPPKDISFNENLITKRLSDEINKTLKNKGVRMGLIGGAIVLTGSLMVGVNVLAGKTIGSVFDGIKNSITKHKATKEADAQAQQA